MIPEPNRATEQAAPMAQDSNQTSHDTTAANQHQEETNTMTKPTMSTDETPGSSAREILTEIRVDSTPSAIAVSAAYTGPGGATLAPTVIAPNTVGGRIDADAAVVGHGLQALAASNPLPRVVYGPHADPDRPSTVLELLEFESQADQGRDFVSKPWYSLRFVDEQGKPWLALEPGFTVSRHGGLWSVGSVLWDLPAPQFPLAASPEEACDVLRVGTNAPSVLIMSRTATCLYVSLQQLRFMIERIATTGDWIIMDTLTNQPFVLARRSAAALIGAFNQRAARRPLAVFANDEIGRIKPFGPRNTWVAAQ
jgi:hypothetical protein